jgi:hypothetical protein
MNFWEWMQQVWPNLAASVIWGPLVIVGTWLLHSKTIKRLEDKVENAIQKREAAPLSVVAPSQNSAEMVNRSEDQWPASDSAQQTTHETG